MVPGCFVRRLYFDASGLGFRIRIAEKCLGIPRTEKWAKTGHADDWVVVIGFRYKSGKNH